MESVKLAIALTTRLLSSSHEHSRIVLAQLVLSRLPSCSSNGDPWCHKSLLQQSGEPEIVDLVRRRIHEHLMCICITKTNQRIPIHLGHAYHLTNSGVKQRFMETLSFRCSESGGPKGTSFVGNFDTPWRPFR